MLILMLIVHFIADFLLQTREMGKNKSTSWKFLLQHIGIIFICFLPFGLVFSLCNALIHLVIDKFIWNVYKWHAKKMMTYIENSDPYLRRNKVYKYLDGCTCGESGPIWHYWEDPVFYSFIGFDQLLHTLTIVFLIGALK